MASRTTLHFKIWTHWGTLAGSYEDGRTTRTPGPGRRTRRVRHGVPRVAAGGRGAPPRRGRPRPLSPVRPPRRPRTRGRPPPRHPLAAPPRPVPRARAPDRPARRRARHVLP